MATKPTSLSKMNLFAKPNEIGPPDDVINRAPGPVLAPVNTAKPKSASRAGKGAKTSAAAAPTEQTNTSEPATTPKNDEKAPQTASEAPAQGDVPGTSSEPAVGPENASAKGSKGKGKAAEAEEQHKKPWDGQDNEIRQSFDLPVRIRTKLSLLKGFGKVTNQKQFVRDVLEAALDGELKKLEQQGVRF